MSNSRMGRFKFSSRWLIAIGLVAAVAVGLVFWFGRPVPVAATTPRPLAAEEGKSDPVAPDNQPNLIRFELAKQESIGVKFAKVELHPSSEIITAPGRVAPNESRYAYITPRAAGVVRTVSARIGQTVRAGDVLATIDSPEVAQARLDLYKATQLLEVAQAKANWETRIHQNTLDLLARLKTNATPDEIHREFATKPVGDNREKLMTAYAQYRLGKATIDRYNELIKQELITVKQFEQVRAEYEASAATYQSLLDQMEYTVRLSKTTAEQSLRQAETAVKADREQLRVLGVMPDGTLTKVRDGKVVGVRPDGTLPRTAESVDLLADKGTSPSKDADHEILEPIGSTPATDHGVEISPLISTYPIWAPFDAVVLDRATVVPGIAVDKTQHLFTLADLSTVWIEAHVHESDFDMLSHSKDAEIRFTSPAYADRKFGGKVIYTGDMVDEKSRSVLLLARAENPDRALKSGMFVEVEIVCPTGKTQPRIPVSAVLTEGGRSFVYVRVGPEEFVARDVTLGGREGDYVSVSKGLDAGQEVVAANGFKLKASALRVAKAN